MSNKSFRDERGRGANRSAGGDQAACIDAGRVFDSCSDRDCAEDLLVYFPECDQQRVARASAVRAKKAAVLNTDIDVEELPFQDGYYACNLTFFIEVQCELYEGCGCAEGSIVRGCCIFRKKVILYGGEGSVQVFSSNGESGNGNMPHCSVQVAEPVALSARLSESCGCQTSCACGCPIPESVYARFGGRFNEQGEAQRVLVTLGLFTIVQMIRQVQLLVPIYDYCIPCKECACDDETPCELFRKMSFPTEEFFPSAGKGTRSNCCDK